MQIREIARRAREEHRRTSVLNMEVDVTSSTRFSNEISLRYWVSAEFMAHFVCSDSDYLITRVIPENYNIN